MTGIQIAWEDVWSVASQISGWLIGIGVVLVAMIALLIFAGKISKSKAGMIRIQSVLAGLLAIGILVNGILMGPMKDLLSSVLAETGSLSAATVQNSKDICEEVASEGIIMTKNDGTLPLTGVTNRNVFGWASTNPVYGGTGSGTVDASTAVTLLGGLENAGFSLNSELSDKYVEYRGDRPAITINNGQDRTLPEPTADSYDDALMSNAKSFSDTALLVIARCGGEGADLPHDMGAVMDGSYQQGTKYTNAL